MGTIVPEAGRPREGLHLNAHRLRGVPGGVALLAINKSRSQDTIVIFAARRDRYTLSADKLESDEVKLNGTVLRLGPNDTLPRIAGVAERPGPMRLGAATITFLAVLSAGNLSCGAK